MENLVYNNLSITMSEKEGAVCFDWQGVSDSRDTLNRLNDYFSGIKNLTPDKQLVFRFNDLRFMHSSTIAFVLKLVKELNQKKISTTITYQKDAHWQAVSFQPMQVMSNIFPYLSIKAE